jgi:mono/diheme cytochrome c family protein
LALASLTGAIIALIGVVKIYAPSKAPAAAIQVAGTTEQIQRGERLAYICVGCHGSNGDLPLSGGMVFELGPLATLYAPNLTPGGELKDWSDGEIIRAIRDGVHRSGRALILMPSVTFHGMSDADVQSLVAYMRSEPAVENAVPEPDVKLLGGIMLGLNSVPTSVQPPTTGPVVAPPAGVTPEYGNYLTGVAGCRDCHGEDLMGGTSQFAPVGPPLPPVLSAWSAADFVKMIRTGTDPNGHTLDSQQMPYKDYDRAFSDEELEAIFTYASNLAK